MLFQVRTQYETDNNLYNDYGISLASYCTGNWVLVQIPYTELTQPYPSPTYNLVPGDIVEFNWLAQNVPATTQSSYDFSIDDLEFYHLTAQPTPIPSPTFTPPPSGAAPGTLHVVPQPNPNPSQLKIQLGTAVTKLDIRMYSEAYVLAWQCTVPGNFSAGWNTIHLPAKWSSGLANGPYFLFVKSAQSGKGRSIIYVIN